MTTRILITALLVYAAALNVAAANTAPPVPLQDRNTPAGMPVVESFTGPDHTGKDGVMARVGFDLALLHQEHRDFIKQSRTAALKHEFRASQSLLRVKNEKVVIDAVATKDAEALARELKSLGMETVSVYGRMVSGRIPIPALEQASQLKTLQLARPAYARAMTGTVTSQGDAAQLLRGDAAPLVNDTSVPDGIINTADLLVILRKALILP